MMEMEQLFRGAAYAIGFMVVAGIVFMWLMRHIFGE